MKNIAVGVDFTEADADVLAVAAPLAKELGATLHLVHVQRELSQWVEYSMISIQHDSEERRRFTAATEAKMDALAESIRKDGLTVDAKVVDADPLEGLLNYAGEGSCDLIVVGSHGRNRIERALLGHVADRVVRKSPIPVMVVPTMELR